jgi:hypothetical protein
MPIEPASSGLFFLCFFWTHLHCQDNSSVFCSHFRVWFLVSKGPRVSFFKGIFAVFLYYAEAPLRISDGYPWYLTDGQMLLRSLINLSSSQLLLKHVHHGI